ncbi:odorant receptor 272 [Tribolium castaneum]|uniref:Odorant receptor n=1 Tax=Tribolium castaneum TaxID=7070 RepID=D6WLG7_TRICA|nr:odorant receptor 272 [Tribolium castaneum]
MTRTPTDDTTFDLDNFMKNDSMKLVRVIAYDTLKFKITKLILFITFLVHFSTTLIQVYFVCVDFNVYFFVKYAPAMFGSLFVMVSIIALFVTAETDMVVRVFRKAQLRKLTVEDGPSFHVFQKECKIFTVFFVLNLIIALFSGYLHALPDDDDREIFYAFAFFEDYCSEWKDFCSFLYRITFLPVAYVMYVPINVFVYAAIHLKSQIYYLKEHLIQINEGYDISNNNDLFYDENYQRIIREKMIYLYKIHVKLFLAALDIRKLIRGFIALFAIVGCLLGISILYFVMLFQGNLFDKFGRLSTLTVVAFNSFAAVIISGQMIESSSSDDVDAIIYNCNWYDWNEENKRFFLLIRMATMHPFKLQFSQNYAVNYQLGVAILKAMYSAFSLLKAIKNDF